MNKRIQTNNEHASYWVLINNKRYCGFQTIVEAQNAIAFFQACGCKDRLEIEADYEIEQIS